MKIKNRIKKIRDSIPKNVSIVAATKTKSIKEIKEAIDAKINILGENYVKEAENKHEKIKGKAEIHCIGHLQKNKVKKAVEIFDMIQTVDSEKLAEEIDKRCKNINKIMPVLIEINIAEEQNKSGCNPEEVQKLAESISRLDSLKLKGLMTMAPYFKDAEKTRHYFKKTKEIFKKLKRSFPQIDTLSMGMSDSYKVAIEEGTTMVRLGTAIFGDME